MLGDGRISRREWLGVSLGAGAALALAPGLLGAVRQSGGKLIERAIPSTGEMLPVIGLQFGNPPPPDHAALKEVLRTLVGSGGKFLDTVHGNSAAEEVTATIANELGVQGKVFWSSRGSPPGPPQPGAAAARAQVERTLARFNVPRLDLVLVNPAAADPAHLAVLKELILPLARERKIGVVTYFPFGARGTGGLFRRAGNAPLPEWAAEFDAATWAQFFLKYVVGHPAVTVVRAGTSRAEHMLDNIGGGIGRLPDEKTRRRMAELVDSWPPDPRSGKGG